MLNELLALERSLQAYGFAIAPRHPDLSRLQKGDVVRVRLDVYGAIAEVELLRGETRPEIWTLGDGNKNRFPGLKTGGGLIVLEDTQRVVHDDRWKAARSAAAKRIEIERLAAEAVLVGTADDWPNPAYRTRITQRLAELRPLAADNKTNAVPAVFERFITALTREIPFRHHLYTSLLDRSRSGDDSWLGIVRAALIGEVPIAVDITRDFARDAGDERQIEAVSRALYYADASRDPSARADGICGLTGNVGQLLRSSFPQPTLPIGQTYLFSRNVDIRSFARYRRNGPSSMPVSADLVGRFSGALTAVTHESRRGKTWRLLPTEAGDKQDLFVAFIASSAEAEVANFLSSSSDDDEDDGSIGPAQVEHATARVVTFWKGVADRAGPGERARMLILRTLDPGNRKAVYERAPSVDALHQGALDWLKAMSNAPPWISLPHFKAKRLIRASPRSQAPLSLIPLSRKLYLRGGRDVAKAPGVPGSEALALFLNEGDRPRRARKVLRLLLDYQAELLVGITHADLRDQLKTFDPQGTGRTDALQSLSWIGAQLWFLGREKEVYMEGAAFKLGQLLSAVDAVHMGYCAEVRGGNVPPTLIGNSVFASAGRNPDKALDVLQTRWKPYHAWATRAGATRSEKEWAVLRAIKQAGHAKRLCSELQPFLARIREEGRAPDEAFRAELLLGYVAGSSSEKTSTTTKQS